MYLWPKKCAIWWYWGSWGRTRCSPALHGSLVNLKILSWKNLWKFNELIINLLWLQFCREEVARTESNQRSCFQETWPAKWILPSKLQSKNLNIEALMIVFLLFSHDDVYCACLGIQAYTVSLWLYGLTFMKCNKFWHNWSCTIL